jgi:putative membrane protein
MKTHLLVAISAFAFVAPLSLTAQPAAALTDANIAAIVVAANNIDIKEGKLAEKKSDKPDVKGFGEMMVRDHESVNQQATDLVTKLGVKPVDNDTSKGLKKDAEKTYDELKAKKGSDFDHAYIANEIAYHEAVIGVVQNTLIPNAQNAELKSLLQAVLPALQAHLDHAKHVQTELK